MLLSILSYMASRWLGGHSGKIRKAEKHEVHIGDKDYLNLINVVSMKVGFSDLAN